MHWISKLLTGLVAVQHLYILWIEMFAWTTRGKKTFRSFPEHLFEPTKALAANQGLYNGFLAMGLCLVTGHPGCRVEPEHSDVLSGMRGSGRNVWRVLSFKNHLFHPGNSGFAGIGHDVDFLISTSLGVVFKLRPCGGECYIRGLVIHWRMQNQSMPGVGNGTDSFIIFTLHS